MRKAAAILFEDKPIRDRLLAAAAEKEGAAGSIDMRWAAEPAIEPPQAGHQQQPERPAQAAPVTPSGDRFQERTEYPRRNRSNAERRSRLDHVKAAKQPTIAQGVYRVKS